MLFPTSPVPFIKDKKFLWGALYSKFDEINASSETAFYVNGGGSNNISSRRIYSYAQYATCIYSGLTFLTIEQQEIGGIIYNILPNVQYMYITIA